MKTYDLNFSKKLPLAFAFKAAKCISLLLSLQHCLRLFQPARAAQGLHTVIGIHA
jgi:hypothetical protein